MRTFVTLSAGSCPQDARPVFSSDDPFVVEAAIRALIARAGAAALLVVGTTADGDELRANISAQRPRKLNVIRASDRRSGSD